MSLTSKLYGATAGLKSVRAEAERSTVDLQGVSSEEISKRAAAMLEFVEAAKAFNEVSVRLDRSKLLDLLLLSDDDIDDKKGFMEDFVLQMQVAQKYSNQILNDTTKAKINIDELTTTGSDFLTELDEAKVLSGN